MRDKDGKSGSDVVPDDGTNRDRIGNVVPPTLLPCPFCGAFLDCDVRSDGYAEHPVSGFVLSRLVVASDRFGDWNRRALGQQVRALKAIAECIETVDELYDSNLAAFARIELAEIDPDGNTSDKSLLSDPATVHLNMLHGRIAKLTDAQVKHLHPHLFDDPAPTDALPKRASAEALASLKSGEGFATSNAEGRWISDMEAGVYDSSADAPEAVDASQPGGHYHQRISALVDAQQAPEAPTDAPDNSDDLIQRLIKQRDEAEAELNRALAQIESLDRECDRRHARAEEAEADADRLADALHHMVNATLYPDEAAETALTEHNKRREGL